MAYGIIIRPDGWNRNLDITTSCRLLSPLGRISVLGSNTIGDVNIPLALPAGYSGGALMVIPSKAADITFNPESPSANLISCIRGASASGNTLNLAARIGRRINERAPVFDISVFEIPPAQTQTYGIALKDAVNFTTISDSSRLGYVTWIGTVNINREWSIPSVANRDNCVVFARWENQSVPLFFDRDSMSIKAFTNFAAGDGAQMVGVVNNVQIVIVSGGFSPQLPSSGYGIVIRNAQNQITFSSALPPVIWRGGVFTLPFYMENSSSGSPKIDWRAATGNVALPMVPLGNYGYQCGDYDYGGTYPSKPMLYSGLLMSGNSVSTYRAKPAGMTVYYQTYPSRGQAGLSLPCLDAADYF